MSRSRFYQVGSTRRFLVLISFVLVAGISGSGIGYGSVGPGVGCAHGFHPVSSACVNGANGERYYGGFDDFRYVPLIARGASATNGIHTNQEMWFYTHLNESQWVEMGIRWGYWIPCSCVTYVRFWADFDAAGNENRHTINYPAGADNTEHEYEVVRDSTTTSYWDVYADYNYIGRSTDQGSSIGYEVQHGLETTEITNNTGSDLANHSPLEYLNTSGTWVHDPYRHEWVDSPCGDGTGSGTTCLTGYSSGPDVFFAGKAYT